MLKMLRDKKASFFSWLIIGGIVLTFTLWGYFSKGDKGDGVAAVVNGTEISIKDFQKRYRQKYNYFQQLMKGNFNAQMAKMYNLRVIALEDLINSKIITQAAQKNGIVVTNQDISIAIQKDKNFKNSNNQFDLDLYTRILKANRLSQKVFENSVKENLYVSKIMEILGHSVKISPYELEKQYIIENDKAVLKFLKLSPLKAKVSVSQKEVATMITNNGKEVEKYYKENISKYKKSEQVKAKHILIRDNGPDSKKKIESLAKKATPKNFAKLAKENSEGPTKTKGGDLGLFDKKTMDPAFTEVAFSTKPGTVSKPVKSQFGWHIIYVEKKIKGYEKPIEQVETSIARKLIKEKKQKEITSAKATKIVGVMKDKRKLASTIASMGLKWKKTTPFKYGTYIPEIGKAKEVIASAFKLNKKGELIPRYFFIGDSYFFFKLESRIKPDMKEFRKKIADIKKELTTKKEKVLLNEWQSDIKKKATILKNPQIVNPTS
jgi:peptidyl-prolyl cis-trans isomerase D